MTREEIAERSEPPLTRGSCALGRADVATVVRDSLLYFQGQRYWLHGWCIMPNHVHVVVTPLREFELPNILHSWKSFTANQANEVLRQIGTLWERESFDHLCRTVEDAEWFVTYTEENPVQAGLCAASSEWKFSSAYRDCDADGNCGAGFQPAS